MLPKYAEGAILLPDKTNSKQTALNETKKDKKHHPTRISTNN